MKLLKELNAEIDNLEASKIESVTVTENTNPAEILSIIGLFAPVLIMVLQAWKTIPGKNRANRNLKLDKAIAALQAASIFSSIKFNK